MVVIESKKEHKIKGIVLRDKNTKEVVQVIDGKDIDVFHKNTGDITDFNGKEIAVEPDSPDDKLIDRPDKILRIKHNQFQAVSIQKDLLNEIKKFVVNNNQYNSIADFVKSAIREKLAKEQGLINIQVTQEQAQQLINKL